MWPEIMSEVIGRPVSGCPAQLHDVRRQCVKDEVYPAIVPCAGCSVDGILYENLSASEMDALDRFEGEEYERRTVTLRVGDAAMNAQTYFAADAIQLTDDEWCPERVLASDLERFRSEYKGWA